MTDKRSILDKLYTVIENRMDDDIEKSYTAQLLAEGLPKIAQKVGEESVEIITAALSDNKNKVIEESADLLYHLLVLWAKKGVVPEEVWDELSRREGVSGIEEKASRK